MTSAPYPSDTTFPGSDIYPGFETVADEPRPAVSDAANELYSHLTQIAGYDFEFSWVLLQLCESVTGGSTGLDALLKLLRDSPAGPGWSSLMDLTRVPAYALPWLGQFVGAVVPDGSTEAQAKSIILDRPATARGRPSTLLAAVQATLTGGKHAVLLERDSSAYHGTIEVKVSDCPDPAATRAAIAANKPGMLIIDLAVLSGPSYGDILADLGGPGADYGDREAMFPTYGDILTG